MLVFASCGNSYKENQRISRAERARIDSIDRASFKIGVLPTLDCLPIYVAYSENLFDTLGVEVHIKPFTAQMDCDTALIGGSVEGSITDLIRARHLQEQGVGLDCSISTNTYWQLITNRLSRIKSLDQLSDKMIAITRNSATDYLADIAIKRGKPKYDCYRIQINDIYIRLAMLRNNEMDAMLLTEPQATTARLLKNPQAERIIFEDICDSLAYNGSDIMRVYIPEDEDSLILNYTIETQKFFELVMEATGLSYDDNFLVDFT